MIKVDIVYSDKKFVSLLIKGHANTGDYGKDLVCAGVSAVSIGALNALEDSDKFEIKVEQGLVSLIAKEAINEHDLTVIEVMILQLKTIAMAYPNAINIKERK
ncbi:MAG TPA: ribosomal-processing cysteine protease Prp [Firmicutes bacterium]|nr:ribosomal-processing cysteine protease Prp [Bacillota bacterium]HBM70081.1 ribosomal-processing cysteine protease Prp [Bacillota bacterium]